MADTSIKTSHTVGVVLVNWNSDEYTVACIESLLNGSMVPDVIVVVDNASKSGSVERILEAFPSVHIIRNACNYGFTGANNIGLKYLLANNVAYAWILNNDTIVAYDCLESMISLLNGNDDVAAVTGKIYYYDTDNVLWFAGSKYNKYTFKISHRGQGEIDRGQYDKTEVIDFFDGCSFLVFCAVLREVGLFDEHFFAYNEDIDLSFRIRQKGYKILYMPRAEIKHKVGVSIRENTDQNAGGTSTPLQYYLSMRNRIYILRRYGNIFQKNFGIFTVVFFALYFSIVLILLGRSKKAYAAWTGILNGLTDNISTIDVNANTVPYIKQ